MEAALEVLLDLSIPEPNSGCWLWLRHANHHGYGVVMRGSRTDGTRRHGLAHRLAWEAVNGAIPPGMLVCHKCDVRSCVNPDHLFLGTYLDNNRDRDSKGRAYDRRGTKNGMAKLTNEQALAIYRDPRRQKVIAAEYGIGQAAVSNIKLRDTWRHIHDAQ